MFSRAANALLLASWLALAPTGATAAPLAASFKSILNVASVGPGTNACGTGRVPLATSGNGLDTFGSFTFTAQLCANPATLQFSGQVRIVHSSADVFFATFNGTFIPSGESMEVHEFFRITGGKGRFSQMTGAGTAKGVASVVNAGPGPGTVALDGSIFLPNN